MLLQAAFSNHGAVATACLPTAALQVHGVDVVHASNTDAFYRSNLAAIKLLCWSAVCVACLSRFIAICQPSPYLRLSDLGKLRCRLLTAEGSSQQCVPEAGWALSSEEGQHCHSNNLVQLNIVLLSLNKAAVLRSVTTAEREPDITMLMQPSTATSATT